MLFRSVDDRMITKMLPKTFMAMEKWDGKDLPDEPVYEGLYEDLSLLKKNKTFGKIIARLNYEKSGFRIDYLQKIKVWRFPGAPKNQ